MPECTSSSDDFGETATMKLDGISLCDRIPQRCCCPLALRALEQKLRKFFDGEDLGHGSLINKPPEVMVTAQYFKIANTLSCYPIRKIDWMALVNAANYKKRVTTSEDNARMVKRPQAILGSPRRPR